MFYCHKIEITSIHLLMFLGYIGIGCSLVILSLLSNVSWLFSIVATGCCFCFLCWLVSMSSWSNSLFAFGSFCNFFNGTSLICTPYYCIMSLLLNSDTSCAYVKKLLKIHFLLSKRYKLDFIQL